MPEPQMKLFVAKFVPPVIVPRLTPIGSIPEAAVCKVTVAIAGAERVPITFVSVKVSGFPERKRSPRTETRTDDTSLVNRFFDMAIPPSMKKDLF
jgi:hypothetical protein